MSRKSLQIREAVPADALKIRALRLEGLQAHAEAFGADYETDKNLPQSFWEKNSQGDEMKTVFVAEANSDLVGASGIRRFDSSKMSHSAVIWGVYVSAKYRGEDDQRVGDSFVCQMRLRGLRARPASD